MPTNLALWQDKVGVPGAVRETPYPSQLEDRQVLIKVHAWAINPADAIIQDRDLAFYTYPLILGQDVSGVVEAVGSAAAKKFKVGDRTYGFTINNGFRDYVTLDYALAAKIPDNLSFVDTAVFGLCAVTSAFALFGKDYLGLPFPKLNSPLLGKSVLIWGGSSAVGSNAIQLAKGAGLEVVTTCSPHNFDYVKSLGADKVFDYNSPTVTDDIAAELDKGICAGIYLATGSVPAACQVSFKSKQKLLVASSNPVMPGDAPEGVEAKMTFGKLVVETYDYITPVTYGGYVAEALEKGVYKVAPPPQVVSTKGLEGIQHALDLMKKGVSGKKLVVTVE